jgi:hypothetical protein
VDGNVPIREAIKNGAAVDYKLHVIQVHGERMEAILKLFKEDRLGWCPIAAMFSDMSVALDFAATMCHDQLPVRKALAHAFALIQGRVRRKYFRGDLHLAHCRCKIECYTHVGKHGRYRTPP